MLLLLHHHLLLGRPTLSQRVLHHLLRLAKRCLLQLFNGVLRDIICASKFGCGILHQPLEYSPGTVLQLHMQLVTHLLLLLLLLLRLLRLLLLGLLLELLLLRLLSLLLLMLLLLMLLLLLLLLLLLMLLLLLLLHLHCSHGLHVRVVAVHNLSTHLPLHPIAHLPTKLAHPGHLLQLCLKLWCHLPQLIALHILELLRILCPLLLLLWIQHTTLLLLLLLLHHEVALHHLHHLLLLLRRHALAVHITTVAILHRHLLLYGPLLGRHLGS